MLVISQKKGEKIHIGRDITISIIDFKAGKVRIGIDAPSSYTIVRDSLLKSQQTTLEDLEPQDNQD